MRYDGLLRAIERATAKYEAEVQRVLAKYAKRDVATADDLMASLKKPRKNASYQDIDSFVRSGYRKAKKGKKKPINNKKLHWTQKPENKERLRIQLTKAAKARAANGTT
jgi:hypothetical protein